MKYDYKLATYPKECGYLSNSPQFGTLYKCGDDTYNPHEIWPSEKLMVIFYKDELLVRKLT